MSFIAKYPGDCEECDWGIEAGEEVHYVKGQFADTLAHVQCSGRVERKTETCTDCWLIKPCECEDS